MVPTKESSSQSGVLISFLLLFFFFFELSFESSLNLESEERIADRGTARVKACGGRKVHIAFLLFSC